MSASTSAHDLTLRGLLADFRLLFILFVFFRLMLLIVYQPLIATQVERGVAAGGDFQFYFLLGQLSEGGRLPFRDWWSEFPPIPAHLIVFVYSLSGREPSYNGFAALFGLLMLAADAGNLILVRHIGVRLHGAATGMALAWVYAVLLAPAVFIWWNFEPLVALFLLASLAALLDGRLTRSALLAAAGGLTKFTPLVLLGAVWRYRVWLATRTDGAAGRVALARDPAVRWTALALGVFALVYAVLLVRSVEFTLPSLTAQFGKASYQTVWALLDGNLTTGNFGASAVRLDPAAAYAVQGNPPVVPNVVRLALAGAVGVFVFVQTRRFDARGLVAFATITLLIFFLQAQGWSPQWLAQIIPLLLLCFPDRNAILVILILSLVVFVEYPLLFMSAALANQPLNVPAFAMMIGVRTAILTGFCVALYRLLRQERAAA